jgi:acyl-CoA thioesterase FadM
MYHEMVNANNKSEIFAEAEAVLVWADISAAKSRPVPVWFRQIIQGD